MHSQEILETIIMNPQMIPPRLPGSADPAYKDTSFWGDQKRTYFPGEINEWASSEAFSKSNPVFKPRGNWKSRLCARVREQGSPAEPWCVTALWPTLAFMMRILFLELSVETYDFVSERTRVCACSLLDHCTCTELISVVPFQMWERCCWSQRACC